MYCQGQPFFDSGKPVSDKQRDLFRLYEEKLVSPGETEPAITDPIQAWEWVYAKALKEWGFAEYDEAINNTSVGPDKTYLIKRLANFREERMLQGKAAGRYKDY